MPIDSIKLTTQSRLNLEPPKGKFHRFCDWMRDHKREIGIALLVIGIASLAFGMGAVICILPVTHFTTVSVASFAIKLFIYKGGAICGLSGDGLLFFTAVGSVIGGGMLAGLGGGLWLGTSREKGLQAQQRMTIQS